MQPLVAATKQQTTLRVRRDDSFKAGVARSNSKTPPSQGGERRGSTGTGCHTIHSIRKEAAMFRIEIHPGEGGDDASLFAGQLAAAIARHADSTVTVEGRVQVVQVTDRL